ncbi:MAG: CAP domain-containing protein [Paracoccaceae bacterium]
MRYLAVLGVLLVAACAPSSDANRALVPLALSPASQGVDRAGVLLNEIRGDRALAPLTRSSQLEAAAARHAQDLARTRRLSHRGSDGSSMIDRAGWADYAYCFVAENIARGQPDTEWVMRDWMDSPGHRANILSPRAKEYGLAKADDTWVLVLGDASC